MNSKLTALPTAASLSIILLLASTCALAGEHKDHEHSERREARQEQRVEQRAEQHRQDEQSQQEHKAQQAAAEGQAEPVKKAGRMTPEERRALRRQINEAGQDIYSRKN